jgi:hypothetical protein
MGGKKRGPLTEAVLGHADEEDLRVWHGLLQLQHLHMKAGVNGDGDEASEVRRRAGKTDIDV